MVHKSLVKSSVAESDVSTSPMKALLPMLGSSGHRLQSHLGLVQQMFGSVSTCTWKNMPSEVMFWKNIILHSTSPRYCKMHDMSGCHISCYSLGDQVCCPRERKWKHLNHLWVHFNGFQWFLAIRMPCSETWGWPMDLNNLSGKTLLHYVILRQKEKQPTLDHWIDSGQYAFPKINKHCAPLIPVKCFWKSKKYAAHIQAKDS